MTTEFAQRLAAFVPQTLLTAQLPVGKVTRFCGSSLFTDLSGFTPLTEVLATAGDQGAERLNEILLNVFTPLIDTIHQHGGVISHFYGDAMLVYFAGEASTSVPLAKACAEKLLCVMDKVGVQSAENKTFTLSLKCGIGFGKLVATVVETDGQCEFVLAGSSVDEATAAEKQAQNNTIVFGPHAAPFQTNAVISKPKQLEPPQEYPDWLAKFVPTAVVNRLSADNNALAEHRPITSIFVTFCGIPLDDGFGEGLNRFFRWATTLVRRHTRGAGRVNRILTGDKGNQLHIILGAPTASPDSTVQAMRLALAMERDCPDYIEDMCIGIATGRAFAVPLGSNKRHEYTVIGDVVNLSARLCGVKTAPPIVCDEQTMREAGPTIEFEAGAVVALKGKQQSFKLYRPTRVKPNPAELEARYRALFGRPLTIHRTANKQLVELLTLPNQFISVIGESGSGKSYMVARAVEEWLAAEGTGYVGACAVESAETPYTPWLAILRAIFDLTIETPPAEQIERLQTGFGVLAVDQSLSIDSLPLMFEAMGLSNNLPHALRALDAKTKQKRLFAFIRDSLRSITSVQSHLIVIEDAQWADRASLDLLEFLAAADDLALTFLVTTRDDAPESATPITLHPLEPDETVAYVTQLFDLSAQPLPTPLANYFTRTGDHAISATPLFLEEVVRKMWDDGAVRTVDGLLAVDEGKLGRLKLPNSVHELVLARIDLLPIIQRNVLDVASVIGGQFRLSTLYAVSRYEQPTIDTALESLGQVGLLTTIADTTYLFAHGMTRTATYDTLSFARRRQVHAEVAAALEAQYEGREREISAELALHHSHANHHKQALYYGEIAAQDAFDLYANREALRLCDLSIRSTHHSPHKKVELLFRKARICYLLGDVSTAQKTASSGVALGQSLEKCSVYEGLMMLSEFAFQQGDHVQSTIHSQKLIEHLHQNESHHKEAFATAYSRLGKGLSALGQHDEALSYFKLAEDICIELNDLRRFSSVQESIAYLNYSQFKIADAIIAMEKALDSSRLHLRNSEYAAHLNNLALLQRLNGNYVEALRNVVEAIPIAQKSSERIYVSLLCQKVAAHACLGDYNLSEETYWLARQLITGMNDDNLTLELLLIGASELFSREDYFEEAKQNLDAAAGIIANSSRQLLNERVRLAITHCRYLLHLSRYPEAIEQVQRAKTVSEQTRLHKRWVPILCLLEGKAQLGYGNPELAKLLFKRGINVASTQSEYRQELGMLSFELSALERDRAGMSEAYKLICQHGKDAHQTYYQQLFE